jgi:hypothetical protein
MDPASLEMIHPAFAAMTFSITLTASQWCLFWRLLNVGSMLSDELLDSQPPPNQQASKTAHLWNRLSSEFAALLERGDIVMATQRPAGCASESGHSGPVSD